MKFCEYGKFFFLRSLHEVKYLLEIHQGAESEVSSLFLTLYKVTLQSEPGHARVQGKKEADTLGPEMLRGLPLYVPELFPTY